MAIKAYNPTTPGRRNMTSQDMSTITTKKPLKSLTIVKTQKAGRNNQGRITTRHRGGGARKFYRLMDFNLPAGTVANIPIGSIIHAIELHPGKGAQIARSAGNSAQLMAKEGEYAQVKLPSGEVRMVHIECTASIGVVGNEQHQNIKIGKAGRTRRKGFRPTVRGVVMNAADHPHGGGDGGRHGIGKDPRTPWGQKTLGFKTRTRKRK